MPTDDLFTDDDVERGVTALLDSREQTPFIAEHIAAVLDAVLPAIRVRWMKELAEGKADCFDLGWMARETEVNGLLETIERLRRQVDALDGHPDVRGTR